MHFSEDVFDAKFHLRREHVPLFFHEYMHLLQDRTTLHGAIDFLHLLNGIQSAFKHASFYERRVVIPMRDVLRDGRHPQDQSECWLATTERVRKAISGQEQWPIAMELTLVDREIQKTPILDTRLPLAVTSVTLLMEDRLGDEHVHKLTAWEICEGCATAVEESLGGSPPAKFLAYQYHVISAIFKVYYPAAEAWQIAEVCQWALQSPGPAAQLFSLLDGLKKKWPLVMPEISKISEFCRAQLLADGFAQHKDWVDQELSTAIAAQRGTGEDNPLSDVYRWYAETTVSHLRGISDAHYSGFPLFLMREALSRLRDGDSTDTALALLFTQIPVPMIEQDGLPFFTVGSPPVEVDSVMLLRCINTIVMHIWAGESIEIECPLWKKCRLPCRSADCQSRPWENLTSGQPPCAFGYAAAAFDLTTKEFALN